MLKKLFKTIKSLTKEVILGVIIGVIIILLTPTFNDWSSLIKKQNDMKSQLEKISIGISKDYIDSMFGSPLVNDKSKTILKRDYEKDVDIELNYIFSGYKLKNSVLLCLFDIESETLFAYIIIVNSEKEYKVSSHLIKQTEEYLLDFTYSDFSDIPDYTCGNDPPTSDDWAYYCELYNGNRFSNYGDYIIGEYKVQYYNPLFSYGLFFPLEYTQKDKFNGMTIEEENEYKELRKKYCPNFFGMIDFPYSSNFDFFCFIGSTSQCSLLFDDWW